MMHRSESHDAHRAPSAASLMVLASAVVAAVSTAPLPARAQSIVLAPYTTDPVSFPVDIANAGDDRLFVVEKGGAIRVVESDGSVLGTPFLDLGGLVSGGSEQGLLGLAFHPSYLANGYFYVNYTDGSGDTVVARYSVGGDPNVADAGSAAVILTVDQTFSNHNGGDLAFGPDGYLYIGLGDGGSGCDPNAAAQDPMEMLGKMLRIDVDGGFPYAIPPSNPFVGSGTTLEEIWALGLRNPWRFSFDRTTGDLYVGDVGQGAIEEIDFQPAASAGGENYGWRCYEGSDFNPCGDTCMPSGNVLPVHEYTHGGSPFRCSVTGGFVYRGSAFPSLDGEYFFADYCSGDFWSLSTTNGGLSWDSTDHGVLIPGLGPTTFGEGADGEIYVGGGGSNTIYRIEAASPPPACPESPAAGCSATARANLKIKRHADPSKSRLQWKWLAGPQADQGDFGNPVDGGTSYRLCIYDGTDSDVIDAGVPTGARWRAISTKGYKFSHKTASDDGVQKMQMKGGPDGKPKIQVKAKGDGLDLSSLPLDEAVQLRVQLVRNDGAECWESVFPAPLQKDDAEQVKAKIP